MFPMSSAGFVGGTIGFDVQDHQPAFSLRFQFVPQARWDCHRLHRQTEIWTRDVPFFDKFRHNPVHRRNRCGDRSPTAEAIAVDSEELAVRSHQGPAGKSRVEFQVQADVLLDASAMPSTVFARDSANNPGAAHEIAATAAPESENE
jgi:hypothetical protein